MTNLESTNFAKSSNSLFRFRKGRFTMGFLMFLARKISLQNQDNDIQYQLTTINNKLQDYTNYASILSQDSVSLSDISALPSSLFAQGMADLTNAHYQAMQISNTQFGQAMSSGMFGNNQNVQIQEVARQKMYENARKQIQKQLSMKLNEEEKSLQAKKTRLEALDAEIQQELQGMDQKIAGGIKSSISTYGLQG